MVFGVFDQPMHGSYHIFPSRKLSSITRIICKKYNILRIIAPATCEHHLNAFRMHALGVEHTYEEITDILRIIDAPSQFVGLA
jgi:hypothetical protein